MLFPPPPMCGIREGDRKDSDFCGEMFSTDCFVAFFGRIAALKG